MATLVSAVAISDSNTASPDEQKTSDQRIGQDPTENSAVIGDSQEYNLYFDEFRDIKDTAVPKPEDDEEISKTPDECEQQLSWLKDAGYGHLTSKFEDGHDFNEEELELLTATLTNQQARIVKKRVIHLTATLRRRPKLQNKTDVRNIFPQDTEDEHTDKLRRTESTPIKFRGSISQVEGDVSKSKPTNFLKRNAYEIGVSDTKSDNTDANLDVNQHPVLKRISPPQHLTAISDTEVTLQFMEIADKEDSKNRLEYTNSDKRDTLPHFILAKDELGITHIDDLSSDDLEKIKSLALIELTALFDTYNIIYNRKKHKRKTKESGVFGVSLEGLMEHDSKLKPGITVPIFFQQVISHLEQSALSVEGILRVSGSASRIKNLRVSIEEKFPQNLPFSWDDVNPNDAAALLKQFLRELPVPLLTFNYLEAFQQISNVPEKPQQLKALNLIILNLPLVHQATLKLLLRFLRKIAKRSGENKMGLSNIAMIMAPNLFMAKSKQTDITVVELSRAAGTSEIMKMMIKYHNILWTVPPFMLMQVRHQVTQEKQRKARDKNKMKFLGRKDKYKESAKTSDNADLEPGIIRVTAPDFPKCSTSIKLNEDTTAADILEKFINSNQEVRSALGKYLESNKDFTKEATTFVFEVGGNIGERRLDHGTNMMALYRINPGAEWIIKTVN